MAWLIGLTIFDMLLFLWTLFILDWLLRQGVII